MSLPCHEWRRRQKPFLRGLIGLLLVSLACGSGCKLCGKSNGWTRGECVYDQYIRAAGVKTCVTASASCFPGDSDDAIELAQTASALEATGDPTCVDLYFAAACNAWQHVASLGDRPSKTDLVERSQSYHACLAKLLATAQRYDRLDPTTGLTVCYDDQPLTIPVVLHGFAWSTEDFNQLELVGDYEFAKHAKEITTSGIGVPLVVVRRRCYDEQFYRRLHPFAATAVLRSRVTGEGPGSQTSHEAIACDNDNMMQELVLEFYNPERCTNLAGADKRWTLAGNLTAPLAWAKDVTPNNPVNAFLRPDGENAKAQLVMLEPYQPGKIPLVFVHGLLSDPTTWVTVGNALRGEAWFRERYQVWVFRYPSGMPFLVSAATLRRELNAALTSSLCAGNDPAAQQMVLIGHSMGGLVAKLQVTDSGTNLWDVVANRPLDEISASNADRERLREVFFFTPQPFIRQVIFLGTPHRGAELASRGVGRVSSCLARSTTDADARHRRIVAANPGVFKSSVARHIPTSIDLLEPDNPLLLAMECMTVSPCVQLHSIIGVARFKHHTGPSDGVVALSSATHAHVVSEKLVSETHEELHEASTTLIEIERILQRQLRRYDRTLSSPAAPALLGEQVTSTHRLGR